MAVARRALSCLSVATPKRGCRFALLNRKERAAVGLHNSRVAVKIYDL